MIPLLGVFLPAFDESRYALWLASCKQKTRIPAFRVFWLARSAGGIVRERCFSDWSHFDISKYLPLFASSFVHVSGYMLFCWAPPGFPATPHSRIHGAWHIPPAVSFCSSCLSAQICLPFSVPPKKAAFGSSRSVSCFVSLKWDQAEYFFPNSFAASLRPLILSICAKKCSSSTSIPFSLSAFCNGFRNLFGVSQFGKIPYSY